jgi:hypothetical protein
VKGLSDAICDASDALRHAKRHRARRVILYISAIRRKSASVLRLRDRLSLFSTPRSSSNRFSIRTKRLGLHSVHTIQSSIKRCLMLALSSLSLHRNRHRQLASSLSRSRRAAKVEPDEIKILKSPGHQTPVFSGANEFKCMKNHLRMEVGQQQ